jgi:peptidoglycan/LPS O-acetylase OafA/YrhL
LDDSCIPGFEPRDLRDFAARPGGLSRVSMTGQGYLPRLDGLRAVAVFLVLLEHFYLPGHWFGGLGVVLFFVISGYLITSILITYSQFLGVRDAARKFYWCRLLRLAPPYYLCIAIAAALNIAQIRQAWWINVLYLTNFQVAAKGAWNGYSHFWTLSVEEQFYLLWFAAVMFVPRKTLPVIAIACFYLAPLYRWVADDHDMWWYGHLMLPAAMDSLAAGALLAYATRFSMETELWRKFVRVRGAVFWASLATIVVLMYEGMFLYTLTNVFAVCLVSLAVAKTSDWRVDWLGVKTLCHFGKISYGIYVFHLFVPQVMNAHWHFIGLQRTTSPLSYCSSCSP